MVDAADNSVVLVLLQVAFLAECNEQRLSPQALQFSCVPDLVADCHEKGKDTV